MTSADLTERERNLEREQKAWRQEKVDLERDIPKLIAEKDYLKTALGKTRATLEELKTNVQELSLGGGNLKDHNKTLMRINVALEKDNKEKTSEYQTLSAHIEALKTTIDEETEAYRDKRLAEADAFVTEKSRPLHQEIITLTDQRNDLIDQVNDYKTKKEEWDERVTAAEVAYNEVLDTLRVTQSNAADMTNNLTNSINDLKIRESNLKKAVSSLDELNRDLMAENKQLKAYEDRAWTVLKAKDEELLAREQAVEEKEQFKPVRRSLLPPTEE